MISYIIYIYIILIKSKSYILYIDLILIISKEY